MGKKTKTFCFQFVPRHLLLAYKVVVWEVLADGYWRLRYQHITELVLLKVTVAPWSLEKTAPEVVNKQKSNVVYRSTVDITGSDPKILGIPFPSWIHGNYCRDSILLQ